MKYVAFLRGIAPMNPNMRNEKLRGVCEGLGFTNVRTFISSGNIVFDSPLPAREIEEKLEAAWPDKLGFASTSIVRSHNEIKELVAAAPFGQLEHGKQTSLNVTFLQSKPAGAPKLEGRGFTIPAQFDREICCSIDMTAAKTPDYMVKVERVCGKKITTRTWNTVQRIMKLMDATLAK